MHEGRPSHMQNNPVIGDDRARFMMWNKNDSLNEWRIGVERFDQIEQQEQ